MPVSFAYRAERGDCRRILHSDAPFVSSHGYQSNKSLKPVTWISQTRDKLRMNVDPQSEIHRVWIIPPAFLSQQNQRFEIERELREREGEFSFPIQDRRRLVSPLSGLSAAFSPTFHSSYAKPLLQVDRGRRREKREEPERRNGHCKDAATWTDRTRQVSQIGGLTE